MFGRKAKTPSEQPRDRRSRAAQGSPSPAFSYYTSRTPEPSGPRTEQRVSASEQGMDRPRPKVKIAAQLPLLLLGLIAVVCLGKLLLLGTDPKVIMLGTNDTSNSYVKPAATYQTAAQKLLSSSATSHTKITVNLEGTAAALRKQFPELQAVSVTLPLIGNRPIVYAQVAQPSVIVQSAHGNYALNSGGLVLSQVHAIPSGVPLLIDQSGVTLQPGRQYLPGSTISFIQTLAYQFNAAELAVSAYVLPPGSPYELDVRLEGKPYVVRCNLTADALVQSGAAIATIGHLGGTVPSAYVDVRTPGRVYYK